MDDYLLNMDFYSFLIHFRGVRMAKIYVLEVD